MITSAGSLASLWKPLSTLAARKKPHSFASEVKLRKNAPPPSYLSRLTDQPSCWHQLANIHKQASSLAAALHALKTLNVRNVSL